MFKKLVWVFAAAIVGFGAYLVMAKPSLLIKLTRQKAELQDPVAAPADAADPTVENPQGTWEVEYVDSEGNPLRPQTPIKPKSSWFSLPFLKKQTSVQAPDSNSVSLAQAGKAASNKPRVDSISRRG